MNKMYMVSVSEYTGILRAKILDNNLFNTLNDALYFGKNKIKEYCYNSIYNTIDDNVPDYLTEEELNNYINLLLSKDINLYIVISVVSTNRIIFNTFKDLSKYFNDNINNISNEELYDFLLSLVDNDTRFYDHNGNYLSNFIFEQQPKLDFTCGSEVYFNEEDCKKGIYTFNYRI